jgi:hypothetical protein
MDKKSPFLNEEEKLKKRLAMTYTERFHLLIQLIRINQLLKSAVIIHSDKK